MAQSEEAESTARRDTAAFAAHDSTWHSFPYVTQTPGSDNRITPILLNGPPLIYGTDGSSFRLSALLSQGVINELDLLIRKPGFGQWTRVPDGRVTASDAAEWIVSELEAGAEYEYRLQQSTGDSTRHIYNGKIRTARTPGHTFRFDLITDTHIYVNRPEKNAGLIAAVGRNMTGDYPDFILHIGDMLDFHDFGFNEPSPAASLTRAGYVHYRNVIGDILGNTTHYFVIGNWDGENGDFTEEEIERSRSQRLLYMPTPTADTYAEGGSDKADYYAFTWGDALFIVLNVMSYTKTGHYTASRKEKPDDWTLGRDQLDWLRKTLVDSAAKWKFIFVHHPVGGNGGNSYDSAYGRGGGRAAKVGEQAMVHELMKEYGVNIFFYGHDHVFFDMVIDDIHYTLPGSAGAPWMFTSLETGYPDGEYRPDSGHARIQVSPSQVNVEFVNLKNEVFHGYRVKNSAKY